MRSGQYRTFILPWHRRAGKDEISLHDTAIRAMTRVGDYWHMLPVAEQARKAIWEATNPRTGRKRWKDAFPEDIIAHIDNQSMKLTFVNGSTWQVLGSDNYDSLVGTTPVHIVMSEAALADPNAIALFRPILLENNGSLVMISSTRGKNFFYDAYNLGLNDQDTYVELLSAFDTDVFTPDSLKKEMQAYISLYGEAIGLSLFRQEYLSDWNAATIGAVFTKELNQMRDEGRVRVAPFDPRYPVITSWDIGVSDLTVILFLQMIGDQPRLIDWYAGSDIGLDHYAKVLQNKPYFYSEHLAPHDIAVREWTSGLSRIDEAKKFGIDFVRVEKLSKSTQIAACSSFLKRLVVHELDKHEQPDGAQKPKEIDCGYILEALSNYKFKFDKKRRVMSKEPEHNWASHYADALMVAAVGLQNKRADRALANGLQGKSFQQMPRMREILARQRSPVSRRGAW